jgi:glycosyltransferase involved in cell wall biosynthesis
MKTITIFGLIYSQHVSNFAATLKRFGDFSFLGLNKKEDVVQGEYYHKQSKETFDEIVDLHRNKIKSLDNLQRALKSFFAIARLAKKSDIVQFHFISPFVLPLAIITKCVSKVKISAFIYGSDFLRAKKIDNWCIDKVFALSDSIVCDSTNVFDELKVRYPKHASKMNRLYFGSPIIDKLLEGERELKSTKICNKGKKVIMCGYNATKQQQHLKILESLNRVAKEFYWVFPMTYSNDDKVYIEQVRNYAEKKELDYVILDSFLSEEEWSAYIQSTDVFIHMQVSDAFSSSISEHLMLGHILINGSWLPYKDLDDNEVFYISSDFDSLDDKLSDALSNYDVLRPKLLSNRDKVVKMKSLNYCIKNYWVPYFNKL